MAYTLKMSRMAYTLKMSHRNIDKMYENCRGEMEKLMLHRYFCSHEIHNNLEVMEHMRGVGIMFSYVKYIFRLNIGNLYTQVGAMLIQNKQTMKHV